MTLATILGTGEYLPGSPISNDQLHEAFGLNAEWIHTTIGTQTRYFAVDLGERKPTHTLADMAEGAARAALASAGVAPGDVDVIVMSTATPDHLMPATVNVVADRLGINRIPTFQVQAGCAGAIQALQLATSLLATGARNALVIGADSCRKHFTFDLQARDMRSTEMINLALFGDGAGAAVLTSRPRMKGLRIDHLFTRCEGAGRKPGQVIDWFGQQTLAPQGATPRRRQPAASEDYKAIAEHVPIMAREALEELLSTTGWSSDGVDFYLPPQLAGHITERICTTLGLPERGRINCVAQTGNNGNALPFLQLLRLQQQAVAGNRSLLMAIESSKWLKTGMALTAV